MSDLEYKEAYEQEHLKCADLAARIADLEAKNEELEWKLNRIKNNPLWKASKPVRSAVHWMIRQKDRVANCGGLKGIIHKIGYKKRERRAMKQFGTDGFPDEARRKAERETVFPQMVTFSILVPLYNTPKGFLTAMLDSVMAQTYENWELCLADGSDADHGYVGEICQEYAKRQNTGSNKQRIVYQKLERNEGISGNTNRCLALATGEYLGLFDHDDILHPSVLYEYAKAINEQGADYLGVGAIYPTFIVMKPPLRITILIRC